jgi:hypothetical protein
MSEDSWLFLFAAVGAIGGIAQIAQLYFQIRPVPPKARSMSGPQGVFVSRGKVVLLAVLMSLSASLAGVGFYRTLKFGEPDALVTVSMVQFFHPGVVLPITANLPVSFNVSWRSQTNKAAFDVEERILASIRPEESSRQETEVWMDLGNAPFFTKRDLAPGQEPFRTVQTRVITDREADDLRAGRLVIYLVSQILYRDKTGKHETQSCQCLQPPGDRPIWHICKSHNSLR